MKIAKFWIQMTRIPKYSPEHFSRQPLMHRQLKVLWTKRQYHQEVK